MVRTIQAEWMKTRHNKLFTVSAVIVFCYPLLMALKDYFNNNLKEYGIGAPQWLAMSQDMGMTLLLMILSGLIITLSFQKEYTERTIITQLTSPITRAEFLVGKLVVWGAWHMLLTVLSILASAAGAAWLFPGEVSLELVFKSAGSFLLHGVWVYLSLLPLPAVALLQKGVFYPSLLLCLAFTGVASMMNVLTGMLPFLLPWSAARVLGTMPLEGMYRTVSILSVLCCGGVGLGLSIYWFRRQRL